VNVVARQGNGVGALAQLDLEIHQTAAAEPCLATREVEFPHAAEPLVVERTDTFALRVEALPPSLKGTSNNDNFVVGSTTPVARRLFSLLI